MKFRKKPVTVDAVRFNGTREHAEQLGLLYVAVGNSAFFLVCTLEGNMQAAPGDWIITGVMGEKYPCKPDVFSATYERVEDE